MQASWHSYIKRRTVRALHLRSSNILAPPRQKLERRETGLPGCSPGFRTAASSRTASACLPEMAGVKTEALKDKGCCYSLLENSVDLPTGAATIEKSLIKRSIMENREPSHYKCACCTNLSVYLISLSLSPSPSPSPSPSLSLSLSLSLALCLSLYICIYICIFMYTHSLIYRQSARCPKKTNQPFI